MGAVTPIPNSFPKHQLVLQIFRTAVEHPGWTAVVEAWCMLKEATGFQVGKALPATDRPEAVKWWDEREDFYEGVVTWWVRIDPDWRKAGLTAASSFEKEGLKQESQADLDGLFSGLNGLTSVLACLWWWHQPAGISEGKPAWRKLLDDVAWVLGEKQ
ncbi:hypothetical protein K438DRAFT_1583856 [Mycena galopus ATCC 62051]|nr:hypothetical protein K438DRAFT_1583856 [Mycena galopus ATCC 62051]